MNETFNERLVDLALNIHHFNQDVMELNIKYSQEIERLNNIINEIYTKALNTSITSIDLRDYIISNLGSGKE